MRLAFVSNCPLPYHTPILNALAEMVDLRVVFMSSEHPTRHGRANWGGFDDRWGEEPRFSYEFSWSHAVTVQQLDFRTQVSAGISLRLRALRPDVVLVSSWGPLVLEPVLWAKATGRRAVMWAESSLRSGLLRDPVTNAVRRSLLARIDGFVSNGTAATNYLRVLRVDERRIITSCLPSPRRPSKAALVSVPSAGSKTYLFVGRLMPAKRVADVLHAFARVLAMEPDARLLIVGSGPDEIVVKEAVAALEPRANYLGRREGEELSRAYLMADVLLVPAEREVWGLVVNEGLAHGLYVIATDEVAAAVDLVRPGTGCVYPVGDTEALLRAMQAAPLASTESRLRAFSTVESVTPARFAMDIVKAAEVASAARP